MTMLNLNYSVLIYQDSNNPSNPKIRDVDITRQDNQVCVSSPGGQTWTLYPGDVATIATTLRSLSWDNTTQLHFQRYLTGSDNLRMLWTGTGTAPAFKVDRAIGGDATTTVSISRVTPYVARITNVSGTAWDTSRIQNGDVLKFERNTDTFTSPFSASNLGQSYVIQTASSTTIDFVDNGSVALDTNIALGSAFSFALEAFSAQGVKIGDTLEVPVASNAHPSNQGRFTVVDVSPTYLEVVSPLGLDQIITYNPTAPTAIVYDRIIGFLHARSVKTGSFKLRFDNNTAWTTYDSLLDEAFFLGSVRTYQIQASNDGPNPVVLSVQYSTVQ